MHISFFGWLAIIYIASAVQCWLLFAKRLWWLAFFPLLNTASVVCFFVVYLSDKVKRRRELRNWNKRRWEHFSKRADFPFKGQKL